MVHTVVVVDDDPDILDFLQLLLSMQGIDVVASDYTGDVAALIRQVLPDVVLLDLQTPEDRRAGLAVLDQLRADVVTATIPVILMTADHSALRRDAARIQELGATPLPKPFDLDRLCQMVEQVAP